MSIKGTFSANYHEGSRSEYLAQYVFSAFGSSSLVLHQEDYGIDLQCTLGDRQGQRIYVDNYFLVQVKSIKEKIEFTTPDDVKWLVSLHYPLFICFIDKSNNIVEIYQTLLLAQCYSKTNIKSICLIPESNENIFRPIADEEIAKIYLGQPIIQLKISDLADKLKREEYKSILKKWVELDQSNINDKLMGFGLINVPNEIMTNKTFSNPTRWVGNFARHAENPTAELIFNNSFLKLISQLLYHSAKINDIDKFNSLKEFVIKIVHSNFIQDCWGLRLLVISFNEASEYLHIEGRLKLIDKKGNDIDTSIAESVKALFNEKAV